MAGNGVRARWGGLSVGVRWVLAVFVVGFAQGACAHVIDLVRGGVHVYADFGPWPLQAFFVALVVLDPLVVVLVVLVRRIGVWLAGGVMVLDVVGNWYANWGWLREDPAWLLRPVGLLPITLFGVFVVCASVVLLRGREMGVGGRTVCKAG